MICWSMKMRMVTRTAGTADTRQTHHGLAPKGKMIQPRAGLVGCQEQKGHLVTGPAPGAQERRSILTRPGGAAGWCDPPAPPPRRPSCGGAGGCSRALQAKSWARAPRSGRRGWHWVLMVVSITEEVAASMGCSEVLPAPLHTQGKEPKPGLELVALAPA